MGDPVT
jgi:hypothetical protein